jgi:DNA-binding GntR family transcriptional regulator
MHTGSKKVGMTDQTKADSLREHVYQRLRSALGKGLLGSSRTATERDLAEQLGVSRTPVREALVLLKHEGLISSTTRGFSPPQLSSRDLEDLFQIRRMLEPGALASTIDRLSAHDFGMLRQHLGEQEEAHTKEDVEAFVEANSRFRSIWLEAVPNAQLRTLIERHDDHVRWLRYATLHDPKARKKVIAGLHKILSTLRDGNSASVTTAMLAHLEAAEQALSATLNNSSDRTAA